MKKLVVPSHFDPGLKAGGEVLLSGDVDEVLTPRNMGPIAFGLDAWTLVVAALVFLPVVNNGWFLGDEDSSRVFKS